jgi:hypothetical protein
MPIKINNKLKQLARRSALRTIPLEHVRCELGMVPHETRAPAVFSHQQAAAGKLIVGSAALGHRNRRRSSGKISLAM